MLLKIGIQYLQGQRARNVNWYEGVGNDATIPKSIENVLFL